MQHTSPTVMPSAMRKITWRLRPTAFNSVVFSLCWHGNGSDFVIEKKMSSNKSFFEGSPFLGALLQPKPRLFVICLMKVL